MTLFSRGRTVFCISFVLLIAFSSFAAKKELRGAKPAPAKEAAKPVLTKWTIDPVHSAAHFQTRHLGVATVRGSLQGIQGEVTTDESNIANTSVNAFVEVKVINTGVEKRDSHLKGDDFFAADQHPRMTFVSTKVVKQKNGTLKMTGNLTIRGITKEVTWDVQGPTKPIKNPSGNYSVGLSASTTINRKDFGLKWNKIVEGIAVVGDPIKVDLDVELTKPAS